MTETNPNFCWRWGGLSNPRISGSDPGAGRTHVAGFWVWRGGQRSPLVPRKRPRGVSWRRVFPPVCEPPFEGSTPAGKTCRRAAEDRRSDFPSSPGGGRWLAWAERGLGSSPPILKTEKGSFRSDPTLPDESGPLIRKHQGRSFFSVLFGFLQSKKWDKRILTSEIFLYFLWQIFGFSGPKERDYWKPKSFSN